ncbi:MAG: hypothetical protein IPG64_18580 [Haliea sp.]|nr:hypothetical protein [Haliea sp.]
MIALGLLGARSCVEEEDSSVLKTLLQTSVDAALSGLMEAPMHQVASGSIAEQLGKAEQIRPLCLTHVKRTGTGGMETIAWR